MKNVKQQSGVNLNAKASLHYVSVFAHDRQFYCPLSCADQHCRVNIVGVERTRNRLRDRNGKRSVPTSQLRDVVELIKN